MLRREMRAQSSIISARADEGARSARRSSGKCAPRAALAAEAIDTVLAPISVSLRTVFATENVRWKKLVEHEAQRPRSFRAAHGLLELPEDLRLAEHHRIETARDAECVLTACASGKAIQVRFEVLGAHAVIVREPRNGIARLIGAAVDLRAVARRDDRSFLDALLRDEIAQGLHQAFGVENHPLAHIERRGLVVQTESKDLHARV
jgi:hypothetical protein